MLYSYAPHWEKPFREKKGLCATESGTIHCNPAASTRDDKATPKSVPEWGENHWDNNLQDVWDYMQAQVGKIFQWSPDTFQRLEWDTPAERKKKNRNQKRKFKKGVENSCQLHLTQKSICAVFGRIHN